jgi:hypothetical protein
LVGIAPALVKPYLPSWLTSSSALINLRLLRILRLQVRVPLPIVCLCHPTSGCLAAAINRS